jgi:glycine cleavage system transcriptional repressor
VPHYAMSAIGRDRPGIVAAVTAVLFEHGANLEDSQMTILRGHFAMMAVVHAPDGTDRERLAGDLDRVASRLGLEALSLRDLGGLGTGATDPTHTVTVYGADHPGIVHAAADALAELDVGITDLNSRLVEGDGERLYVLMIELALPDDVDAGDVEEALAEVANEQAVEVTLDVLEP